jgi:HlyD family secretion protein
VQTVWVLRDGSPAAWPVRTGFTDGHQTEITGGDLAPGDRVITDAVATAQ